ncbi:hypothetical protein BDDG_12664 [Blastomyces dermatitidis ATCC 18188]|uniref:Uncharacterized protein n=1 Tax=Ajellomyces dermatitidis (strain ATCC 18188 / CBS 674.68) TaxID=653446 RepID=A0A0J9EQ98_AJEDA|nr:hypothetical protein BDDG_12664 [Blastomyces dermatitidis ATCC 18188]
MHIPHKPQRALSTCLKNNGRLNATRHKQGSKVGRLYHGILCRKEGTVQGRVSRDVLEKGCFLATRHWQTPRKVHLQV